MPDMKDIKQDNIEYIENSPTSEANIAEEKALVRKIDLFLLPTIWLMYLLSYMDRTKLVQPLSSLTARSQAWTHTDTCFSQHWKCKSSRHDRRPPHDIWSILAFTRGVLHQLCHL